MRADRSTTGALRMGFAGDEFGFAIDLGLPQPSDLPSSESAFTRDPQIKRECVWSGPFLRQSNLLVDRRGHMVRVRDGRDWRVLESHLDPSDSMLRQIADPERAPEALLLRETIRGWRFYDHFRTDADAPARQPRLGTRTPVLSHDGGDLAAAWQTIREVGDRASPCRGRRRISGATVAIDSDDGPSPCASAARTAATALGSG